MKTITNKSFFLKINPVLSQFDGGFSSDFLFRIWNINRTLKLMSNSGLNSESEDCDNQVLLPISSLFPPNQIISKKYAPDVKPTFRLISSEKKEQRKVTINCQTPAQFWDIFSDTDTLGYEYASRLKNNLVYLKLKNQNYMRMPLKGKQNKYLAGLFVSLEKLVSDNLKKNKNVYKILPNLNYVEYRMPPEASFGNNCFSEAPEVKFSSNYESSNLFAAVRVAQGEYDLILQNDINSKGNTQWFNFTVELNEQRNYKFNIANLTKSSSLYQKGMSIAIYSQTNRNLNKIGWTRGGHTITYTKSHVNREDNESLYYYKLHFEYRSPYRNDIVTFAYCYPYTLIDLERFFNRVMFKKMVGSLKIDKIKVAETLSGFAVNIYAIAHRRTHSKKNLTSFQQLDTSAPSVIFLARQHPGESQSSYITQGIVEWLLENDYYGWKKNFQYYVVPMVNMDGVFYGNYRTNLSGNDLNRVWRQPRKDYHHEVYSLKKFLHSLNKTAPIQLIIDIHGHSNSLNSFFYGNPPRKQCENPKLFPFFCSRKIKQISFTQSTFSISEDKKSCARVVLAEMFPKALVYTFENSFYGWRKGKHIYQHTIQSYRKLGRDLVQCYVQYARLCDKNLEAKQRWTKQIEKIQKEMQLRQNEDVVTESDDQAQNQLIQFSEITQQQLDTSLNKDMGNNQMQKKRKTPSISKTKFVKYLRRNSPLRVKNHIPTNNDTYVTQKGDPAAESQGFLSIIKINTRSHIESTPQFDQKSLAEGRKSKRYYDERKENLQDQIIQDLSKQSGQRQTMGDGYVKVGKLINEKEMAMQKIRLKKQRMEQGTLMYSKTFSGFFKYNHK